VSHGDSSNAWWAKGRCIGLSFCPSGQRFLLISIGPCLFGTVGCNCAGTDDETTALQLDLGGEVEAGQLPTDMDATKVEAEKPPGMIDATGVEAGQSTGMVDEATPSGEVDAAQEVVLEDDLAPIVIH
jgi:hypothetical protein